MLKFNLELINKLGLHARASAKFVATASRFLSKIDVSLGTQTINGKSIMGVMMLGAKCGSHLEFILEGPDEEELKQAIEQLISNKFGEEE
jgi:phosphocarrier protein HPr